MSKKPAAGGFGRILAKNLSNQQQGEEFFLLEIPLMAWDLRLPVSQGWLWAKTEAHILLQGPAAGIQAGLALETRAS